MLVHDQSITEQIIGCAISVHKIVGPGLLESTYEAALCIELTDIGLAYRRQLGVPVTYKGRLIGEHRPDLLVAETVVVEIKSVERLAEIHVAQLVTYLRVTNLRVGLLMNFNSVVLRAGIRRVVL
jgi:GxxExxY protein